MANNTASVSLSKKDNLTNFQKEMINFKKNKTIMPFLIPAVLLVLFFGYLPMFGIIFAFKEEIRAFNWLYDFLTADFTFRHVTEIFRDQDVLKAISNTLIISGTKLIIYFPLCIIFAILLSEIKRPWISKLILIIMCLPNFLSWPVTIGIWNNLIGYDGILTKMLLKWGVLATQTSLFDTIFKPLVVFLSIWKGLGWGSIYFYSAIMSIDKEYYEAATIDGASKVQKIRYLTIPGILPVIALQLVLNITYIMDAGFDQVYAMIQLVPNATYEEQILGTFIFNQALSATDLSFGVAMSVVNGLFALVLMLTGNALVKKKLGTSLW